MWKKFLRYWGELVDAGVSTGNATMSILVGSTYIAGTTYGILKGGGVNNPKVPLRFPSLVTSLLGTPSLLGSHKLLSVLL